MGDLFFDDITSETAYPAPAILEDVYSLVRANYREGQTTEYKSSISIKDNWPRSVAGFANATGGLMIFGVRCKKDEPQEVIGFDPGKTETKLHLANTVLSRIQPRPEFHIRVVKLDKDPTREVALLRVSEGTHSPYMHCADEEKRVFIRSSGRNCEADYLQLMALFEKGRRLDADNPMPSLVLESSLNIEDPPISLVSNHFYRFSIAPNNAGAVRRLTPGIENAFISRAVKTFQGVSAPPRAERKRYTTLWKCSGEMGKRQNFAMDAQGVLGFVKTACVRSEDGLWFLPEELCADLISFLFLASEYYEAIDFHGDCQIQMTVKTPPNTRILRTAKFGPWTLPPGGFFEPELDSVQFDFATQLRVALYPRFSHRIVSCVEALMNDLAREGGTMLTAHMPRFASVVTAKLAPIRSERHQPAN